MSHLSNTTKYLKEERERERNRESLAINRSRYSATSGFVHCTYREITRRLKATEKEEKLLKETKVLLLLSKLVIKGLAGSSSRDCGLWSMWSTPSVLFGLPKKEGAMSSSTKGPLPCHRGKAHCTRGWPPPAWQTKIPFKPWSRGWRLHSLGKRSSQRSDIVQSFTGFGTAGPN